MGIKFLTAMHGDQVISKARNWSVLATQVTLDKSVLASILMLLDFFRVSFGEVATFKLAFCLWNFVQDLLNSQFPLAMESPTALRTILVAFPQFIMAGFTEHVDVYANVHWRIPDSLETDWTLQHILNALQQVLRCSRSCHLVQAELGDNGEKLGEILTRRDEIRLNPFRKPSHQRDSRLT